MEIAILGYGTVGSGVARVLEENRELLRRRSGNDIHIRYVLDLRDFPGDPLADRVVHDIETILADPDVQVVAETMGGLHPAKEFVSRALASGKSVVTSNKDMVAEFGAELMSLAAEKGVDFFYEASVGGGIPIIRAMDTALAQEKIEEICGIVNGTTNYILTKMEQEDCSFAEALQEAQRRGFAEQNPDNDIQGRDSVRKLAILSEIAFGINIDWKQIPVRGIENIQKEDIAAAAAAGCRIKLIAHSIEQDGHIYAAVEPMLLPLAHPLAAIQEEYNCIMLRGNMVGDIYFQGKGAGSHATGSAVVADLSAAVRNRQLGICAHRCMEKSPAVIHDFRERPRTYLLRTNTMVAKDEWRAIPEAEGFVYRRRGVTMEQLEAEIREAAVPVWNCIAMEEEARC